MNSIMNELDKCRNNERAFIEELYCAICMIVGYVALYFEIKINPVYRVKLRKEQ